jgi:hypothetical protein
MLSYLIQPYIKLLFYWLKINILIFIPLYLKKIIYFFIIYIIYIDFFIISIIIPLIISVAYVTLIERKVIGLCNYVLVQILLDFLAYYNL